MEEVFPHCRVCNQADHSQVVIDLNLKKSWHPATLKNQERVWKEERKHAEEQHKIEQMKKELMEERQLQELQRLQEESGQR